jgi:Mismatch repair ATPase (MutS family)
LKNDPFYFDSIGSYFKNKSNTDSFHILSDKTCNDLDFEELFMFLDRTNSKVGQQYLYNKLRTILAKSEEVEFKENLIQKLLQDEKLRLNTQLQLDKLNKEDAYYIASLFQGEYEKAPKWFFVIRLLSFTSLLSLLLLPINAKMFFVFFGTFIVNIGFHYWNKRNLYKYLGSIPQLLKMNSIATNLFKVSEFRPINPDLNSSIQIIKQVRNRMSFFRLEANLQSEFEAIFWGILELIKIAFLLEPLLLFGILKRLDTKRKEIESVYCFIGEIDALISIASLRKGTDLYCIPTINESEIRAEKVYHPLIPNCISNTIEVNKKSILLTGSNMSGKTSFIRTIGLNMICGLTINTCFAESMTFPRLRIYSAIRINDDLINDRSYYFEEVLTIKEMIDNTSNGKANLFLLDEIFKGTNTVERISAGKAVLSALGKNKNFVFVSTHDIELTDLLSDEYELYHFSEVVKENKVDFDYKLKPGKLKNRNAIRILEINDYPGDVIDEAIAISKSLDQLTIKNKHTVS